VPKVFLKGLPIALRRGISPLSKVITHLICSIFPIINSWVLRANTIRQMKATVFTIDDIQIELAEENKGIRLITQNDDNGIPV
jgi:hypothetical protein